jgi:hypothetical protein
VVRRDASARQQVAASRAAENPFASGSPQAAKLQIRRPWFELQCSEHSAGRTDVKKRLTAGVAREWLIALVVACIAILVLIAVATWWVA